MIEVEISGDNMTHDNAPVRLNPRQEALIDDFAEAVPAIAARVIKGAPNFREAHEFAISDGYYGLFRAALRFDESKVAADATTHSVYVEKFIRGSIIAGIRERQGRETVKHEKTKRIITDRIVNKKPSVITGTASSLDIHSDDEDDEFDPRILGIRAGSDFVDEIALKDLIRRGLEDVKPEHKRIFGMYYLAGMSQHEIAAEVGFSQMHVSRILRRVISGIQKQAGISDESPVKEAS